MPIISKFILRGIKASRRPDKSGLSLTGFTLLEVLIGLSILAVLSAIMARSFFVGGNISIKTDKKRIAVGLAQELIEFAKSKAFGEEIVMISTHRGFENYSRTIETEYVNEDDFNRVSPVETDFIKVTVIVSEPSIPDVVLATVINKQASLVPSCE